MSTECSGYSQAASILRTRQRRIRKIQQQSRHQQRLGVIILFDANVYTNTHIHIYTQWSICSITPSTPTTITNSTIVVTSNSNNNKMSVYIFIFTTLILFWCCFVLLLNYIFNVLFLFLVTTANSSALALQMRLQLHLFNMIVLVCVYEFVVVFCDFVFVFVVVAIADDKADEALHINNVIKFNYSLLRLYTLFRLLFVSCWWGCLISWQLLCGTVYKIL